MTIPGLTRQTCCTTTQELKPQSRVAAILQRSMYPELYHIFHSAIMHLPQGMYLEKASHLQEKAPWCLDSITSKM